MFARICSQGWYISESAECLLLLVSVHRDGIYLSQLNVCSFCYTTVLGAGQVCCTFLKGHPVTFSRVVGFHAGFGLCKYFSHIKLLNQHIGNTQTITKT